MKPLGNDRWRGEFSVAESGRYQYTVEGWIDRFQTWRKDLEKRIAAKQDVSVDLLIGARLIEATAGRAKGEDAKVLLDWAQRLRGSKQDEPQRSIALDTDLLKLVQVYPERELATRYDKHLTVIVDREKAGFSAWYEVFPRSCSAEQNRHGTLRDCEQWLPYIASMGFDVVYLPPPAI
jgi:starch synthase (maltosyl-transferring)